MVLLAGCPETSVPEDAVDAPGDARGPSMDGGAADATEDGAVTLDARAILDAQTDAGADAGPRAPTLAFERITDQHRFVPGAMFGGWGPHLGHLVRASGTLYWVDDLCDQGLAGDCDVLVNRRVGVLRHDGSSWTSVGTMPLSGVQQNTGALASTGTLRAYGVDVVMGQVRECTFDLTASSGTCTTLGIPTGANANYVGAAISPLGHRVAWWTNVSDGGGGGFSYVVDYGGGWNGPRAGPIAGYNDCAYVAAGVHPRTNAISFFGQVVSGRAPAWSFATLVGEASLSTSDAPTWANVLAAPPGDTIASTNDLYVDDVTGEGHLLARATSGAVVYYHQPDGGPFGAPTIVEAASYRARFLVTTGTLAIVSGPNTGGLRVRLFARTSGPLPIADTTAHDLALPSGFGAVLAIYPEADLYQVDPVGELDFAVVGATRENEAWYASLTP